MTPLQKTIAYSAIFVGILAIFLAIGSSLHIAYHIFTFCQSQSSESKFESPPIVDGPYPKRSEMFDSWSDYSRRNGLIR